MFLQQIHAQKYPTDLENRLEGRRRGFGVRGRVRVHYPRLAAQAWIPVHQAPLADQT